MNVDTMVMGEGMQGNCTSPGLGGSSFLCSKVRGAFLDLKTATVYSLGSDEAMFGGGQVVDVRNGEIGGPFVDNDSSGR